MTRVLGRLALAREVSCSGTVETQEGLFKIINLISSVLQTVTAACTIECGENGLQELLKTLCEGVTGMTDLPNSC